MGSEEGEEGGEGEGEGGRAEVGEGKVEKVRMETVRMERVAKEGLPVQKQFMGGVSCSIKQQFYSWETNPQEVPRVTPWLSCIPWE